MSAIKKRGNGQGSVYQLTNGNWCAEVTLGYDINGKRISHKKTTFKSEKTARTYLNKYKKMMEDSGVLKRATVAQLYQLILPDIEKLSKGKQTAYNIAYKNLSPIHHRFFNELRPADMQPLIDGRSGGYYPKRDMKCLLRKMCDYAMMNDMCEKNYVQFIKLPECPDAQKDAFTEEELECIWALYRDKSRPELIHRYAAYALVMCYVGLRPGELRKARKEHIHLEEQYMQGCGIKTKKGKGREMVISNKILPVVRELYIGSADRIVECCKSEFERRWREMTQCLPIRQLTPGVGRHTYNTRMAEKGVQPGIIMDTAGHKNFGTTKKYIHTPRAAKLEAVNKL